MNCSIDPQEFFFTFFSLISDYRLPAVPFKCNIKYGTRKILFSMKCNILPFSFIVIVAYSTYNWWFRQNCKRFFTDNGTFRAVIWKWKELKRAVWKKSDFEDFWYFCRFIFGIDLKKAFIFWFSLDPISM